MVLIPDGRFLMGTSKGEVNAQFKEAGLPDDWKTHVLDEEPRHQKTVKAFYLYKHEVTNAQYKVFIDATEHRVPAHWKGRDYIEGRGNHPVVEVSWDDAAAYCQWAGTRLPTEAEWEYAARGGSATEPSRAYPWGDKWDRTFCNNSSYHAGTDLTSGPTWNEWYAKDPSSYPLTTPVGSFPQSVSPFGIHDMAGNAWEWCAEVQAEYPELKQPEEAGDNPSRARRGGSWANVALHLRSADRQSASQDNLNLYTGFRCAKDVVKNAIRVEQAGDRFVNFVLDELQNARGSIPAMTQAAEAAADRIVGQDGEFLAAGDHGFALEPVWRAGGIAFARLYDPNKPAAPSANESDEGLPYYRTKQFVEHFTIAKATSKDVVLIGYENEKTEERELAGHVKQLLADGALIIFFGTENSAAKLEEQFGKQKNLIAITHNVPNGGLLQIPGWPEKICSGRHMATRARLWAFQAELIGAFLRRGKMPGILLSVTYESPQVWNIPLLHDYKFVPAFNVPYVERGDLGNTYLDHIQRIVATIVPGQRLKFRQAAQWLAEAVKSKQKAFALLIHGVNPEGLSGDPGLFTVYSEGNAHYPQLEKEFGKDDVALFVGYNWYPPQVAETVDKAGGKQILCFTLVQDIPSKPAVYGEVGELPHPRSFEEVPQSDSRVYIDLKFAQYNAVLTIPGYPIPALESSTFAEDVVYWHLVADTVELLLAQ